MNLIPIVKIIADSIDSRGNRITTMQLKYQRFFHSEFLTHRQFSRNASSSRAIPTHKLISEVLNNPATPSSWGENKSGMQAGDTIDRQLEFDFNDIIKDSVSHTGGVDNDLLKTELPVIGMSKDEAWKFAANFAAKISSAFSKAGYHKQISNRITETYQSIDVIVTATEWDNFFNLRDHEDAQPEFEKLAKAMKYELKMSDPRMLIDTQDYHHPYVSVEEFNNIGNVENGLLVSAARCARVSYLNHDGTATELNKDIDLALNLLKAGHMSPFEHQAQILNISNDKRTDMHELQYLKYRGLTHIDVDYNLWSSNLKGFGQFRNFIKYI